MPADIRSPAQLRESLIAVLPQLPPNALVGLITFGKHVAVHELGFGECSKCYVFRGNPKNDNVSSTFVADMLGMSAPAAAGAPVRPSRSLSNAGRQRH